MNLARRWWGPVGNTAHNFETLVDHRGETITRVGPKAACGWVPPGGVMEGQVDLERPDMPLCRHCLTIVYTQACEFCEGQGEVEVCPRGHTGCPCSSVMAECPECGGSGREEVSDEVAEALEAGPGQ